MAYSRLASIRRFYATSLHGSPLNLNASTVALRYMSTMARTYESALRHLDSIQSNKAITSLFSPPPPSSSSAKPTPQDLNAQAIPEMLTWLQRAGLTQTDLARLHCIHVAGTKGKGSVCAYLTSILSTQSAVAGKVGTYTSPHLVSVRERVQINGQSISQELFARYFFEVWEALTAAARAEAVALGKINEISQEELEGPATKPFYFRFLTILAFHAFLREGVKSVVVECGIGGEYDSTNVLPAEAITAAVVSQLGIDHVGMLGATLPEIAWHKAGVCKAARKCFTRLLEGTEDAEETMQVLRRRAAEKNATLAEIRDEEVERWGGVRGDGVRSLEGEFQKYNQALAVKAANEHLRILSERPDAQPGNESLVALGERFSIGLRSARLRGRCETRQDGDVTWFIDGAHTAESLEEVAKWFAGKRKTLPADARVALLFNQQERDVAKLLGSLLIGIQRELGIPRGTKIFDDAIFTRNDLHPRSADEPQPRDRSVQTAAANAFIKLCPGMEAWVIDNVKDAVTAIRAIPINNGHGAKVAVLATGSLHLVGALLRTLEPDAEL